MRIHPGVRGQRNSGRQNLGLRYKENSSNPTLRLPLASPEICAPGRSEAVDFRRSRHLDFHLDFHLNLLVDGVPVIWFKGGRMWGTKLVPHLSIYFQLLTIVTGGGCSLVRTSLWQISLFCGEITGKFPNICTPLYQFSPSTTCSVSILRTPLETCVVKNRE